MKDSEKELWYVYLKEIMDRKIAKITNEVGDMQKIPWDDTIPIFPKDVVDNIKILEENTMKYESWKEAVDLSIKVWKVLAKKGYEFKEQLPPGLWYRIKHDACLCPLCQYASDKIDRCYNCPLENCGVGSLYHKWHNSYKRFKRMFYAYKIVKKLKRWNKENKSE